MTSTPLDPGQLYLLNWESYPECAPPPSLPNRWRTDIPASSTHGDPFRITCPGEPVRSGTRSVRFQLYKDDPPVSSGSRAEVKTYCCDDLAVPERWYGFSIYLPNEWGVDNQSAEILTQWHQADPSDPNSPFGGSPPLAIMTHKGKWWVSMRKTSWDNTVDKSTDPIDVGSYDADKGKWTDWVVYVKWSAAADGVLRIWKNGQKCTLTDLQGKNRETGQNKFADGQGNYMKFGIYKWHWSQGKPADVSQRIMYYGEVRISNANEQEGYNLVRPRRDGELRPINVGAEQQCRALDGNRMSCKGLVTVKFADGPQENVPGAEYWLNSEPPSRRRAVNIPFAYGGELGDDASGGSVYVEGHSSIDFQF